MLAERLPRPADLLLLASLALLTTTLFATPLRWLVVEWQQNDYYAHGPFVPLTCLVLGYLALLRERSSAPTPADALPPATPLPLGEGRVRASRWGQGTAFLALAATGLTLRALAAVLGSDFLGSVAL